MNINQNLVRLCSTLNLASWKHCIKRREQFLLHDQVSNHRWIQQPTPTHTYVMTPPTHQFPNPLFQSLFLRHENKAQKTSKISHSSN